MKKQTTLRRVKGQSITDCDPSPSTITNRKWKGVKNRERRRQMLKNSVHLALGVCFGKTRHTAFSFENQWNQMPGRGGGVWKTKSLLVRANKETADLRFINFGKCTGGLGV